MSKIYDYYPEDISSIPQTNKVIVLDLDETLVSTQESMISLHKLNILKDPHLLDLRKRIYVLNLEDVMTKTGAGQLDQFWGIMRPHLKEFLQFCFDYFHIVAIWSAGQYKYVHAVVDNIFRDLPRPHVVFSFNDLDIITSDHILQQEQIKAKPLLKMIGGVDGLSQYMSLENTIVVDDRDTTFIQNQENGIKIPPYHPSSTIENFRRDDDTLLKLKSWLMRDEVIKATNVKLLDKSKIFE